MFSGPQVFWRLENECGDDVVAMGQWEAPVSPLPHVQPPPIYTVVSWWALLAAGLPHVAALEF